MLVLVLVLSALSSSIPTEIIQRLLLLERIVHALRQVLAQGRGQIGIARRSHALSINVLQRCREGSAHVAGVGRQLRWTEQRPAALLAQATDPIALTDSRADGRCNPLASDGKALQPDTITTTARSGDVSITVPNTYCAASNNPITVGTALKEHAPGHIEAVGTIALVGGGAESWGRWGRRRPVQAAHGGAQR